MGALLKNIHWIIILVAIGQIGMNFYESIDKEEALNNEKSTIEQEYVKNKKTKDEIKKYMSNIEQEKSKIERVAEEIEKTQQLLPSEISDTENIGLLRKMAENVNIREVSIMPENEENRGFYIARKYKFKAKATYLQFLIMFEKISESKRILNIDGLEFKKLDQPQRSKFQIIDGVFNLEAYRYNTGFKEDRGLENIDKQFKSEKPKPQKKAKPPKSQKGVEEL
jgi:Tfp pilus assembly protein PilO